MGHSSTGSLGCGDIGPHHRSGAVTKDCTLRSDQPPFRPAPVGTYIAVPLPDTVILLGCSAIYWHSQYFGLLSIGIYRIYRVKINKNASETVPATARGWWLAGCAVGRRPVAVGVLHTGPGELRCGRWCSWDSRPAQAIPTAAAIGDGMTLLWPARHGPSCRASAGPHANG